MQYIITNGKCWVIENPMRPGEYMASTMSSRAKHFTFKQAKSLLNSRNKKMSWIRHGYSMVGEDGKAPSVSPKAKGNGGAFLAENDVFVDLTLLDRIEDETEKYLGLAGWDESELSNMSESLNTYLSKLDSEESDIKHALVIYAHNHNGKMPQAHKIAKVGYMFLHILIDRAHVKACMRKVTIMKNALTCSYSIGKLQHELSKSENGEYSEYKPRTAKFEETMKILEG